jgi:hypothetical protein
MVGTSEFIGIEPAQGACQPDEPISHLLHVTVGTGTVSLRGQLLQEDGCSGKNYPQHIEKGTFCVLFLFFTT